MAIYHFSGQIMSRLSKTGGSKSPLAVAAYRSGDKLVDEIDNQSFYYKREVKPDTTILAPSHAPEWVFDRERLWNEVNKIEKNYNAQFAREFNIALPVELSDEQQKALTLEFCQEAFVNKGMVADIAIHRDDERNPHFHVLLTVRPFNEDGSWGAKARRDYQLDQNGNHILDKHGKKTFVKFETTDWNQKDVFNRWRQLWSEKANVYLKNNGFHDPLSHLSHEARGIEQLPTIHEGFTARKMVLEGKESDRVAINQEIKKHNQYVTHIQRFKEQKRMVEREQKLYRKFSPSEKKQLSDIARELKFFVNYKTVSERKRQLQNWKQSIQFTVTNDSKLRQLSRVDKEEALLQQADNILLTESERFIKAYYPTWDSDALSFDEKVLLVEETMANHRLLTDDEIDLMEEKAMKQTLDVEMDHIYTNSYSFALTIEERLKTLTDRRGHLEKVLNLSPASSPTDMQQASLRHPKEFQAFRQLINHMDHALKSRDLMNQLYTAQLKRLYPALDSERLSIQEKDILVSGAEYYEQPIHLESVGTLQKYTVQEQLDILKILSSEDMVNKDTFLLDTYHLAIDNPRHLLFFKDECLNNVSDYPDEKEGLALIKRIDPLAYVAHRDHYDDVLQLDEQMNEQLVDYATISGWVSVTHGLLHGLLQDRSRASKKQFEEDLKSKFKKRSQHRHSGPSL